MRPECRLVIASPARGKQQIHLDYGKARLIGSFAFVVGVMVFGILFGLVGEQYITWMITGILVFTVLLQLLHPNPMPQDESQSAVENSVRFLDLLKNKPPFVCLLRLH